ncbi:MAG: alpha/beta fold hydrolase [Rhodospirillaceae bacterium]|nr:alpha/beta fold hydrolase [Rhodospirillaceae bacterium]
MTLISRATILAAAMTSALGTSALAADGVVAKRGYAENRFGQIHYYSFEPAGGPGKTTPMAFFHQNPKSAVEFEPLTSEMGKDRLVLAFDTPGYGMSDRPAEAPSMSDLAGSMADALKALGYGKRGRQVDVFGFHTGAYIAAELAVAHPELVRRVVMSGVGYYSVERRKQIYDGLPRDGVIPEDASFVVRRWYSVVNSRTPGIPIERAARIFLDDVRSLNKSWFAYNAVWSYVPEDRLPRISQPVLLLQPHEMLLNETRAVKRDLLPNATLIEIPGVTRDVFDTGPMDYAKHLRAWLDAPAK